MEHPSDVGHARSLASERRAQGRHSHIESYHADKFDKVNFDGVLAFSLGQHRARILPSSSPPEVSDRAVR
jgi:hypothetical protein